MALRMANDWLAETAEFVNGEVLEILEGLIKVTLAFREWGIMLVLIQAKKIKLLRVLSSLLKWVAI
jgi:hypothetical protein